MSKEYIDREALLYKIRWASSAEEAVMSVRRMPAADVVEVVRCKDCLHQTERYGHMECIHGVSYRNTWNKPDFFCPYGERKEGAD